MDDQRQDQDSASYEVLRHRIDTQHIHNVGEYGYQNGAAQCASNAADAALSAWGKTITTSGEGDNKTMTLAQ